jgi:hypothetical protein
VGSINPRDTASVTRLNADSGIFKKDTGTSMRQKCVHSAPFNWKCVEANGTSPVVVFADKVLDTGRETLFHGKSTWFSA